LVFPKAAIGTPICFETSFSDISRQFVINGAQVLMSVTNDAWFKDSLELEQHFIMGKVRSVETGRAFVQSANTGLSGIVLPTGEVTLKMEKLTEVSATSIVPLLDHHTLFVHWGSWWVLFVSMGALISAVASLWYERLRPDQSSQPSE
jgi:apolipoprotein N-acyltransferase